MQDGSTTFTFLPPNLPIVGIPANQMVPVGVRIDYPPSMVLGGGWAFYQAIVTNVGTGETFGCIAALWPPDDRGVIIGQDEEGSADLENERVFEWNLTNNGNEDALFPVVIEVMGPPQEIASRNAGEISLDGNTPGEGVTKMVQVFAGETAVVSVTASIPASRNATEGVHDLLFSADTDGDGNTDIVNSQTMLVNVNQGVPTAISFGQLATQSTSIVVILLAVVATAAGSLVLLRRRS